MKRFILAIQFLTRIPINISLKVEEKDFIEGIIYFPIVGLIMGMIILSSYYIGDLILGKLLGSVFAVAMEIFITGGLNLDGLANTFDGVYSNRQKDRILEIMEDRRLGTKGAIAIILLLMIKIVLINEISVPNIYPILLLMPVYSRLNLVYACMISEPSLNYGMGSMIIGKVDSKKFLITFFMTMLLSLIYIPSILSILLLFIFTKQYTKHISNKIDGMTEDTLGALCEISEILFVFLIPIIMRLV